MPDTYYSETQACSGKQVLRIDTRAGVVKRGNTIDLDVRPGQTVHIQVEDLASGGFVARVMSDAQAAEVERHVVHSYVLNRHVPTCSS